MCGGAVDDVSDMRVLNAGLCIWQGCRHIGWGGDHFLEVELSC